MGGRKYRFSIDDNILFLRDLAKTPEKYPSLLDHPYLKFWGEMHQKYGAKFHFNLYFQTEKFSLCEMPDYWKDEWKRFSPWLNLSFHALQDQPPNPYGKANYQTVFDHCKRVTDEIRRFAGQEVISDTTTLHYCESTEQGVQALKNNGVNVLIGLFSDEGGGSYHLSPEQIREVNRKWVLTDEKTGMSFLRCTSVINNLKLKNIHKELSKRTKSEPEKVYVELLIHEQYFRPELRYFQRNIFKKVKKALDWVSHHNFMPEFWSVNSFR